MAPNRTDLIDYLVSELGVADDQLQPDTLLFSSGLLDSFNLIDLVVFIEKSAGLKVRATEVTLDNLDSIERIEQFVERKVTT